MKKALILGTSHSFAVCVGDEKAIGSYSQLIEGRWHDYLQTEYGYEVTNISEAGTTPAMQLAALLLYLEQNPEERWDIAILEGRNIEYSMSMVIPQEETDGGIIEPNKSYMASIPQFRNYYVNHERYEKKYSHRLLNERAVQKYALSYFNSPLQSIDTYAVNLAILTLLETVSSNVRFFCVGISGKKPHPYDRKWFYMLLKKWLIATHTPYPDKDRCKCKHPNRKGHYYIWKTYIKPNLLEILEKQ